MSEKITPEGIPTVPNIDEHPSFKQATAEDPTVAVPTNEDGTSVDKDPQPAIGIHVVFMENGEFGIQATGEPNLGEMQMLLSRALKSIESRMVAETVAQVMKQNKSRIITPGH